MVKSAGSGRSQEPGKVAFDRGHFDEIHVSFMVTWIDGDAFCWEFLWQINELFAGKQLCSYGTWSTVFSHEHRIDISGFVPRSSGQGAFEQVLSGVSDFCHPNFCCFQLPLMFSGSVVVKPIVARDQWLSGYGNRHPRKLIGVQVAPLLL